MHKYFARRLLYAIFSILGATLIAFLAMHLAPGDPVRLMAGDRNVSQEVLQTWRHRYGLDQPLPVQYFVFVKNAVQGDFGTSYFYVGKPVMTILAEGIPVSIKWEVIGIALAVVLGTTLGVISALKQNTWLDNLTMLFALVGISLPSFALATFLIVGISLHLGWLPVAGLIDPASTSYCRP